MPYLLTHFSGPVTVRVLSTHIAKNYVLGDSRLYVVKVMRDARGYKKGEILHEPAFAIYDKYRCSRSSMRLIYTGKNWLQKPIKETKV